MKKLKITTSSLLIGTALVLSAAPVFAKTVNNVKTPKAKNQYASQIKQDKETIKSTIDTDKTLKDSIKAKLTKVKDTIKQAKADKATFKSKKASVKAQLTVLKQDKAALKNEETSLKADRTSLKSDRASKNFQSVVTDLQNIISLQASKKSSLQKLNSDIDALMDILK